MSMVQTPPEDLIRLQDDPGLEFVDGHFVQKPMSVIASRIEATITRLLDAEAIRTGASLVFSSSLGYQCFADDPAKFRRPDISVVRKEKLRGVDPDQGFLRFPPDLAVEVLSPNDLAYERDRKLDDYLKNGFGLVWVVHPNTRSVSVYPADGPFVVLYEQDEITGGAALPALRCKVAEFFTALG